MAREIRDAKGRLIGTVRSSHPILNALAVVFALMLMIYAVSGTGPAMWVVFALTAVAVIGHRLKKVVAPGR